MSPHRIRLPAPWRATRLSESATRVTTPAAESSVLFRRSFQRPSGLTEQSVIALEVTLLKPLALEVALNGNACPTQRRSDVVFEVPLSVDQLQPANELEITVHLPASASVVDEPKLGQNYISRVELVLS